MAEPWWRAALLVALQDGSVAGVTQVLDADPSSLTAELTASGSMALHGAAIFGHAQLCEVLLDKGAQVDARRSTDASTALLLAAQEGHAGVVKLLLSSGAEGSCVDSDGCGPLWSAAGLGHQAAVTALLVIGQPKGTIDVDGPASSDGATPLCAASQAGHAQVVALLLGHGANVQQSKYTTGATPLWLACQNGHNEVAELLVESKASVHARNHAGVTPLHVASQNGHTECVRTLLIAGAQADVRSQQNNSPLSLAQANQRSDVIELLLHPPPVDATLAQAAPAVPVSVEEGEPPAARAQDPMEVAAALIVLEKTRSLVQLGFAPEQASAALASCGGDSAHAKQMLQVAAGGAGATSFPLLAGQAPVSLHKHKELTQDSHRTDAMVEQWFDAPHGSMRYWCVGDPSPGGAHVLFVHGLGCAGRDPALAGFDQPQLRQLCRFGRVVAPDLMGHGGSSSPDGQAPYTMQQQAHALVLLLQHLNATDVSLVGHSMGGPIALGVAEALQQLETIRLRCVLYAEPNVDDGDCFSSRRGMLPDTDLAVIARDKGPRAAANAASCRDLVRESDSGELLGRMQAIARQTASLVLVGADNRGKLSSEALLLGVQFPLEYIADAGHCVHTDNPLEFYAVATRFFGTADRAHAFAAETTMAEPQVRDPMSWKERYVAQCTTSWAAIESNPDAFSELSWALGVPSLEWAWCDVYGLEPELLAFVPQPVVAVTLLWPSDSLAIMQGKATRRDARATEPAPGSDGTPPFYMRQRVRNACGTVAVAHAIANCSQQGHFNLTEGSPMCSFLSESTHEQVS